MPSRIVGRGYSQLGTFWGALTVSLCVHNTFRDQRRATTDLLEKVVTFCDQQRAPNDLLEKVVTFCDQQRALNDLLEISHFVTDRGHQMTFCMSRYLNSYA